MRFRAFGSMLAAAGFTALLAGPAFAEQHGGGGHHGDGHHEGGHHGAVTTGTVSMAAVSMRAGTAIRSDRTISASGVAVVGAMSGTTAT